MITRRQFLRAAAVASGVGLGLGMYTWRWEPHWLETVEHRLPISYLPDRWKGARLVQLSDLHIGPRVDDSYLIHAFERVKNLAPDIVVYTGDFISYDAGSLAHVRSMFSYLPLGSRATLGVLGNHDYGPAWEHPEVADSVAALAVSAGVGVLRNEVAEVDGLHVTGLDDLWANRFEPTEVLGGLDPRKPSLVLSHNPDTVDEPGWGKYAGWILSGHTHGGQCRPPFLPPPLLPVRNRRYTSGELELSHGRRMYISRGVGHLLRVRFNVRPEVTVFHLERA
jgi:predicted MPP superfamily phosphohydrolase